MMDGLDRTRLLGCSELRYRELPKYGTYDYVAQMPRGTQYNCISRNQRHDYK